MKAQMERSFEEAIRSEEDLSTMQMVQALGKEKEMKEAQATNPQRLCWPLSCHLEPLKAISGLFRGIFLVL